jgi:hypothetical protein
LNVNEEPVNHRPKVDERNKGGIMKRKDIMKILSTRVHPEVHRALKIRAAEEGQSIAVIIETLIRQYLTWKAEVGDKAPLTTWLKKNFPEGNFRALPPGTLETWGEMLKEEPKNIKRIFPDKKERKKGSVHD